MAESPGALQAAPGLGAESEAPDVSQAEGVPPPSSENGDPAENSHLELIFEHLGHFGRFQIFLYLLCAIETLSCGIHYLASVYLIVTPRHICRPPGNMSQVLFYNISNRCLDDIWTQLAKSKPHHITVQLQDGEVWELLKCERLRREDKNLSLNYDYHGLKSRFSCTDGYVYDKTLWDSTVVTQWNLVCNQKWFAKAVQSVFMSGVLLGGVIFGYLSDRIGRRFVLWSTSVCILLLSISSALAVNYYTFLLSHFLLAIVASGYIVAMFVYVMEFIGRKYRTWAAIQMHSFFATGTLLVPLVGYLTRSWRVYLLVLSSLSVPFILCCWVLPETPFWLLSAGKYEEAQKVVDRMAKCNRKTSCNLSELLLLDPNVPVGIKPSKTEKHKLFELFHNCNIARRTLIVWLTWFASCVGFYTLSWNAIYLAGNEYLNFFLLGVVEIPAYLFVCVAMDNFGRRNSLIILLILSGLLCGVIMMIPVDPWYWSVMVTMGEKFAIGAAFGLIYLYTAELYPTVIRSLAVGSGSMVSRIGAIFSPALVQLTDVWKYLPQLVCGILALVSGLLTISLPETRGKPLTTTWEETINQNERKDISSRKLFPTPDYFKFSDHPGN
ncbi:solute carrier family 22 member 16 isoform X2 [Talpa occidentalis]|uniref:solute carrier family 22 member 16 isoform X2 n=1 Tax=Talpa occidentalis TaxID=50954 RepID=UPI0023F8F319|nr:solute carrier family 22 member 16 isoform X2 [Talpa occidentalis]